VPGGPHPEADGEVPGDQGTGMAATRGTSGAGDSAGVRANNGTGDLSVSCRWSEF
jgi:hypothetical protein